MVENILDFLPLSIMKWSDLCVIIMALTSLVFLYFQRKRSGPYSHLPLPPGPRRLPLLGNLFNKPKPPEWQAYHRWAKELETDVIYLNIAGTSVLVLDTFEAAFELLEKRSSIYSSRPQTEMLGKLLGWEVAAGVRDYGLWLRVLLLLELGNPLSLTSTTLSGDDWRRLRKMLHQSFHPAAAAMFRPHSLKAARSLLNRFLDRPNDVLGNIRHVTSGAILSIAYGIEVKQQDDPYIKMAERGMEGFAATAVPGAFLVDSIPLLKYVPEWFPGAGFKSKAREWKETTVAMFNEPFEATKAMLSTGEYVPSFVSLSLQNTGACEGDQEELDIKHVAGTMYGAGADTTLSSIASCILGFLAKPDVLKKAQKELDAVIKPGHLPEFEDWDSLPYITAITMETLRWRDVVPIGFPHRLIVEDEFKGYRIPAGTIVLANSWAMLHDENVYPDPFTFNPDRFIKDGKLTKETRDPSHACWGFGRRICPGRFMAFSSIWITIASMVLVFDIKKAVDEEGNIIEPREEYVPAVISLPKSFKCSITPRSQEAERLIRASALNQIFYA